MMHKKKYGTVLLIITFLSLLMACGNEIQHITPESLDDNVVTEPEKTVIEEQQDIIEENNRYS